MNATSPRVALLAFCSALFVLALLFGPTARSQAPQNETHEQRAARFRQMSIDAETKGLAEPFKGITTQGRIEPGLFPIRSSGVSTGPVRVAADAFLAALTKAQRDKTGFGVDDSEWRKWMNQDYYVRLGVSFLEMTDSPAPGGDRASSRGAERQRPEADTRHHAAERNARRAERQRLRSIRRVAVPPHGHGQALCHRALGLAARRPPRDHQLLRARRSGRDDADVRRLGTGRRHVREVQGHVGAAGRAEPGPRAGQGV